MRCAHQGTCFVAGTKIATPRGDIAIQKIKDGDAVYSYGIDGHLHLDTAREPFDKKDKCVSVSTHTNCLVASEDQLIYSFDGWRKAIDLTTNDYIRVPVVCDSSSITDYMMIGCLHGDGFLGTPQTRRMNGVKNGTKKSVYISVHPSSDDFWITDWFSKNSRNKIKTDNKHCKSTLKSGWEISGQSKKIYVNDNLLWDKFFNLGCPVGKKSGEVKLNINEMSNDDCKDFLTGIFSSEGSVIFQKTTKRTSKARICLGMNWMECVIFIETVLDRMDIEYSSYNNGKTFYISISGAGELSKVIKCFDFRMDSRKQARYILLKDAIIQAEKDFEIKNNCFYSIKDRKDKCLPYYSEMRLLQEKYNFSMEHLFKKGKIPKLMLGEIKGFCDNFSAYVPVLSVKKRGEKTVYDFMVNHKDHSFIANGIVAHNCMRRNYGAVIVDGQNKIVSTGYTGSPARTEHCTELGRCWRKDNNIPSGTSYEKCRSVHAEQNAIIQAGREARLCTMYISGYDVETGREILAIPCFLCAKMIVNSGIVFIVTRDEEREYIKDPMIHHMELNKEIFKKHETSVVF